MNPFVYRLSIFLLVPGLACDPVTAITLRSPLTSFGESNFTSQAFALPAANVGEHPEATLAEFKLIAPSAPSLPQSGYASDDQEKLTSPEAHIFARDLYDVLRMSGFNLANASLRGIDRGGNYNALPFPEPTFAMNMKEIRQVMAEINQGKRVAPEGYSPRAGLALEFFMFGAVLDQKRLRTLFGPSSDHLIEEGVKLNLFSRTANGVQMNGLSLASYTLLDGNVVYVFADRPPYLDNARAAVRVYIGGDSYDLMNRLQTEPIPSGIIAEMGSGSAIQLIALLLTHRDIPLAIGLEIDRRAICVSQFNAVLNGVEKRTKIAQSPEEFREIIGQKTVSFGFMDPPSVPFPETIEIDPQDGARWSQIAPVSEQAGKWTVNLEHMMQMAGWHVTAGWGGPDGLQVTRELLKTLLPHLAQDGKILILSSFGGAEQGPQAFLNEIQLMGAFKTQFEVAKPRRLYLLDATEHETTASYSANRAAIVNFENFLTSTRYIPNQKHLIQNLKVSYHQLGLTHFHHGFIIVERTPTAAQATRPLGLAPDTRYGQRFERWIQGPWYQVAAAWALAVVWAPLVEPWIFFWKATDFEKALFEFRMQHAWVFVRDNVSGKIKKVERSSLGSEDIVFRDRTKRWFSFFKPAVRAHSGWARVTLMILATPLSFALHAPYNLWRMMGFNRSSPLGMANGQPEDNPATPLPDLVTEGKDALLIYYLSGMALNALPWMSYPFLGVFEVKGLRTNISNAMLTHLGGRALRAPIGLVRDRHEELTRFPTHMLLSLLDEYFVAIGRYHRCHIPRPIAKMSDGPNGPTYFYEEAKGHALGALGDEPLSVSVLQEWTTFVEAFEETGYHLQFNLNYLRGNANPDHLKWDFVVEPWPLKPGQSTAKWMRIDFGSESLVVDLVQAQFFLQKNYQSLERHLGRAKAQIISLCALQLIDGSLSAEATRELNSLLELYRLQLAKEYLAPAETNKMILQKFDAAQALAPHLDRDDKPLEGYGIAKASLKDLSDLRPYGTHNAIVLQGQWQNKPWFVKIDRGMARGLRETGIYQELQELPKAGSHVASLVLSGFLSQEDTEILEAAKARYAPLPGDDWNIENADEQIARVLFKGVNMLELQGRPFLMMPQVGIESVKNHIFTLKHKKQEVTAATKESLILNDLIAIVNAVMDLHGDGVAHRGLSPAEIHLSHIGDVPDKVWFTDFELSATPRYPLSSLSEVEQAIVKEKYQLAGLEDRHMDVYALMKIAVEYAEVLSVRSIVGVWLYALRWPRIQQLEHLQAYLFDILRYIGHEVDPRDEAYRALRHQIEETFSSNADRAA